MFRAIDSVSGSMGWEIVAKGVETAAQAEVLRGLKIHYMQGNFFNKPIEYSALFPADSTASDGALVQT